MALMNGGQLLVRTLLEEGVKQVFGIPGSQTSTFIDAICRLGPSEGIEFVMTRHNQLAGSLGARGIRVEVPEDVRPGLEETSKSDVMTVIDAVINH